jgi:hypothetical protein
MKEVNELKEEVFLFLDIIRESGVINMLGSTPYIIKEFDISKSEARELLSKYLKQ